MWWVESLVFINFMFNILWCWLQLQKLIDCYERWEHDDSVHFIILKVVKCAHHTWRMHGYFVSIFMKFHKLFSLAVVKFYFFFVDLIPRNCYNLHREQAECFAQVGTSKCSTTRASQVQTDLYPSSNSEIPQMQSLSTPKGNNEPLLKAPY